MMWNTESWHLIMIDKSMKEYKVFKDGDLWCAVNEEFTNIQESQAGFGLTPMIALGELVMQENEEQLRVFRLID